MGVHHGPEYANGDLQLEFADVELTSYVGLELFAVLARDRLQGDGPHCVCRDARWGDFGAVAMVRLVIGLLMVGADSPPTESRAAAFMCP